MVAGFRSVVLLLRLIWSVCSDSSEKHLRIKTLKLQPQSRKMKK